MVASAELSITAFEYRSSQLLDEQGHPTRALDHHRYSVFRERLLRGHLSHHSPHVAGAQAVERDLRVMRPWRPWHSELRTEKSVAPADDSE